MTVPAIKIENLGFRHSGQQEYFIRHLALEIKAGERFGLFGPNGAGKTTLMSLMTGLLPFDEGSIELFGKSVKNKDKSVNKLFGFVPQEFSFYHELTPVENLEFFGAWSGMKAMEIRQRTVALLEMLGLCSVKNNVVAKFSEGMKRRVNLAIGVINNPSILFLDEPTVGVDVQSRYGIISYLEELNRNGTTLVYTSHQLEEAEGLCQKIAFIEDGKIIAMGDKELLLAGVEQGGLEELFLNLTGKTFRNQ